MMVYVLYVIIILIWSIFCFMIGIATGLWYAGNQAINDKMVDDEKKLQEEWGTYYDR